jgi:hypothetical protein
MQLFWISALPLVDVIVKKQHIGTRCRKHKQRTSSLPTWCAASFPMPDLAAP